MNKTYINKFRDFNRLYTKVIGLLDKYLLNSKYTLVEVRIMYEIYNNPGISSKIITDLLGIDKGYLSRILYNFEQKKLIVRKISKNDGRIQKINLTSTGKKEYLTLEKMTEEQIGNLLSSLQIKDVKNLIKNMEGIKKVLSKVKEK